MNEELETKSETGEAEPTAAEDLECEDLECEVPEWKDPERGDFSFFNAMNSELSSNARKGDWRMWIDSEDTAWPSVLSELDHHVAKLRAAVAQDAGQDKIQEYAADVANNGMFAWRHAERAQERLLRGLTHLTPSVRELAAKCREERLDDQACAGRRDSRWARTAQASAALQAAEERFSGATPGGLLITGAAGLGKTGVVQQLVRAHPAAFDPVLECTVLPVLEVNWTHGTDARSLQGALLLGFFAYADPQQSPAGRDRLIRHHLERMCVRMIVFDDLHLRLGGTEQEARALLGVLQEVVGAFGLPVVLTADLQGLSLPDLCAELDTGFCCIALQPWEPAEWASALWQLGSQLPLRRPSPLWQEPLAGELWRATGGSPGRLLFLLDAAVTRAVESGQEWIDLPLLASLGHTLASLDAAMHAAEPRVWHLG